MAMTGMRRDSVHGNDGNETRFRAWQRREWDEIFIGIVGKVGIARSDVTLFVSNGMVIGLTVIACIGMTVIA